jgi:hypothetical protein
MMQNTLAYSVRASVSVKKKLKTMSADCRHPAQAESQTQRFTLQRKLLILKVHSS